MSRRTKVVDSAVAAARTGYRSRGSAGAGSLPRHEGARMRTRIIPALAGAVILASGLAVLIPATAQAAVACDEASLVTAINLANSSGGATYR